MLLRSDFAIERVCAFEIAAKTVALLYPNEDEKTKAQLTETLLPPLVELQHRKELEFVLPAPFVPFECKEYIARYNHNASKNFAYYDDSVYCTAGEAARTLSEKLGRPISVNYIRKLAHRKKHPVRVQSMGDRQLYHLDDIENAAIRKRNPGK
jgi:hypothetical protein